MFKGGSAAGLASLSGAVICRTGDATGASGPTGGWRRPALGGARHKDTVGSWSRARAERGGGDERNEAFGGGAGAADAANPLRAAVR